MRKRLVETRLVGVRSVIRTGGFALMVVLAVVGFAGYLLPGHSVDGGELHSNYADGGAWPLVIYAVFGVLATHLRTRGLGAGMLTGVLAVGAAIGSVIPVLLTHMFSDVHSGFGDAMMIVASLGLFFGGAVLLVAEPLLYVTQRRANERTHLPRAYASN